MSKQYGSYTGNVPEPGFVEAPGAWQAPTEVYRQNNLNKWPLQGFATAEPGDYVFAVASGVVISGIETSNYLVPSGQDLSRTTYTNLFGVLGTQYGSGDGSTTFGLPNVSYNHETCFRATTLSGISSSSILGSGVLAGHNHQVQTLSGSTSTASASSSHISAAPYDVTYNTTFSGSLAGNTPARLYHTPLIATEPVQLMPGLLTDILVPDNDLFLAAVPLNALIASGQALSRTDFSVLFDLIGTTYGSGDGSTTFNLPDCRGLFSAIPYPDPTLPSGNTSVASGFYISEYASHKHTVDAQNNVGNSINDALGGFPVSRGFTAPVAPDSSLSSVTNIEDRPSNVSVVRILVVS